MNLNKLAIVGLGLIGASLAKSIKHSLPNIQIAAFDFPEIAQTALADRTIDIKLESLHEALKYDLIFLALPTHKSLEVFCSLAPQLNRNQVISDLCSVKGIFEEHWIKMKSIGTYIGAHPMTGKEKGGYQNSDNLLFENSIYIISEKCKNCDSINEYTNLIRSIGARVTFLDPYLHDKIVSRVSHLPQLLAVLLVNQTAATKNGVQFIDFAAGGFRDMTRIASSDFSVWESILKYNSHEILEAIDSFSSELEVIKKHLINDNPSAIGELFTAARKLRNETPINSKGFLDPLFDISVFLKDEPGMISKISTVLFQNNINIKDIELLKIREGSGGNFKLYFDSKSEALRAKNILESVGFKTF
ncbi:MAG: prephenate dehydrogenase/arogenate dehydrogenase family protein [Ignavibacteriaceae bacterium]|nr:prephenate dehydrogenase/arogenate dehydrogenase family protein [Ignavibacteriaceae bacterium]